METLLTTSSRIARSNLSETVQTTPFSQDPTSSHTNSHGPVTFQLSSNGDASIELCDYSHLVSHYEFVTINNESSSSSLLRRITSPSLNNSDNETRPLSHSTTSSFALSELLIQLGHVLFENWEDYCGDKGFERLCEQSVANPPLSNTRNTQLRATMTHHRVNPLLHEEFNNNIYSNHLHSHMDCKSENCALKRFFKLSTCQQIHLATNFICNFVCFGVNGSIQERVPTKLFEGNNNANTTFMMGEQSHEQLFRRFNGAQHSGINRLSVVSEHYFNYPEEKDTCDSLMVWCFLREVLRDLVRREIQDELTLKREESSSIISHSTTRTTQTEVSTTSSNVAVSILQNSILHHSARQEARSRQRRTTSDEDTLLHQNEHNSNGDTSYYWRALIYVILRKLKFGNLSIESDDLSQDELLQAASSTDFNIWNTLMDSLFHSFLQKRRAFVTTREHEISHRRRAHSNGQFTSSATPSSNNDQSGSRNLRVLEGTRSRAVSSETSNHSQQRTLNTHSQEVILEKSSVQIKRLRSHFNSFFTEQVIHHDMCKLAFVCQISAPLFMRPYKNLGEKYLRTLFSNSRGTLRRELLAPLEASNQLSFVTVCYWHSFMTFEGYDSPLERIKAFFLMLEKNNFPVRSPGPKTPKQPAGLKSMIQKLKTLI
nr:unnamed protein product [Naegleria fowleri]